MKKGKVEPIYTDNPNDKRLQAYNDSLSLYKKYPNNKYPLESIFDNLDYINNNVQSGKDSKSLYPNLDFANKNKIKPTKVEWAQTGGGNYTDEELKKGNWVHYNVNGSGANGVTRYFTYTKPVQPVIYQKPEVKVPVPKINFNNLKEKQNILGDNIQYQNEPIQEESKGKPLPAYLIQQVKTPNGMKTYKRKDTNSPWIEQDFEKGGIVQAWIQKFSNGGYIADGGFPGGQELTQPTTNYYNWGNYGNQNSFLTSDQINQKPFQNTVPLANTNIPQNIGTNFKTSFDASNDQVNQDNAMADSMMGGEGGGKGMDIGNKIGSAASQAMGAVTNFGKAVAKPDTKASAFFDGAGKSLAVTAPLAAIPVVGQAAYAASALIWGFVNMRKKAIELEEKKKMTDYSEYKTRNTQSVNQPSYYGQYMSKYGSNIKNLEKRLMDDIFSDFDKYMKLT